MTNISREFAESLFSLALEDAKDNEYLEELHFVKDVFAAEPSYLELLSSPALTREERTSALDAAFSGHLSEYVMSFLKLLCEAGYAKFFPECVDEYERMYRERRRTSKVKVTSAVALTDDERERVMKKARAIVGGECDITYSVDPSLLGGAIIETENTLIDGSLKKSLQEIKGVIKK